MSSICILYPPPPAPPSWDRLNMGKNIATTMSTNAIESAIRIGLKPLATPIGIIDSFPKGGKKYPVTNDQYSSPVKSGISRPIVPKTPNPIKIGNKSFSRRVTNVDFNLTP